MHDSQLEACVYFSLVAIVEEFADFKKGNKNVSPINTAEPQLALRDPSSLVEEDGFSFIFR